jgi:aminoglycoside phosphotransferase (APT) family kinase protein
MESHADLVRDEEPALLHNDFHPLNIMLDGERMTLLDWPDAAVGDRHCDVARTLALFWLAAPLERSFIGRTVLGLLRRYIVPLYVREYRSHLALDDVRLRYWEALHAFKAWAQIAVLHHEGEAALGARAGVAAEIPPTMIRALESYVRTRIAALS